MASILIYATGECCLFSLVRINEFLPLIKRGGKKLHWLLLITKSQLQTIDLFYLKNTTHLARGNNLVVSLEEVTSTHIRILLESYSLDSTCLSYAEKVVQRRYVHVLAREAFLVQSESNWVRVD